MSAGHELALAKAVLARLKADPGVAALVDGRVWAAAPTEPGFPHLLLSRAESRPMRAEGCGVEHGLTLTCVSRFRGSEEAKAVLAAVRVALDGTLEADGLRTVSLSAGFAEVFAAADGARWFGVIRVRAVTEVV